jgi:hypothetical protein
MMTDEFDLSALRRPLSIERFFCRAVGARASTFANDIYYTKSPYYADERDSPCVGSAHSKPPRVTFPSNFV